MEGLIKGLESQESWQVQRQFRLVLMHWPKTVGFAVARKTRPISIQRGILYVSTATASWAQTLSYERMTILRKLNRYQRSPLTAIRFSAAQWTQNNAIASKAASSSDAALSRLSQHPSYIGEVPHLSGAESAEPVKTPQAAFQRWATALQDMQKVQAVCPLCRCHCPQGELDRWARCGHCAVKQW